MVAPLVDQPVDQRRIPVEREDHGPVSGEDGVEVRIGQPVRVSVRRLQRHQVDHVHHAHLHLRQLLAQQVDRRHRLQRRHVAGAGHHHVGRAAFVVARPFPDAQAGGAVAGGRLDVQPLGRGLLAGHDDVHVVAAAQAVVDHRQQGVGVGRQVHAHHFRLLAGDVVEEARVLVAEAVVVLAPDVAGEQVVQRRDRPAPADAARHLEPLGVLVEHRVDDVDEGLVAREEAVPPRQQVALEPALAKVLAQHLHHAAVGREVLVARPHLRGRGSPGHLEQGREPVRGGLVRPHHAEVALPFAGAHDLAQEGASDARGFGVGRARRRHGHRVRAKGRQRQVLQQQPAVGVRIGAHAAIAPGCDRGDLGVERAVGVEKLFRTIAQQPVLQQFDVLRLGREVGERHLVRTEGALDLHAVHVARSGPALGGAQHDHRPAGAHAEAVGTGIGLNGADAVQRRVQRRRHLPVHVGGLVAHHEVRFMAVAAQQLRQLVLADARQHGRAGDLVAVEMQHRQHRAVALGVQELVGVPARRQCAGLGLAVAHHAAGEQRGVVEHGAVRMQQRVTKFAAFVDGARRLGSRVARNAARKGELGEQPPQARGVPPHLRIDLAVAAFEPCVGDHARAAVAGARDEDRVEVARVDGAVHVRVDEVEAGRRAPVPQQARLDVLERELLVQQRVVHQVDLAHRQVVGGAPPGVEQREVVRSWRFGGRRGHVEVPGEWIDAPVWARGRASG